MTLDFLQQLIPVFFGRLFPFEDFYRWLSYGEEKVFQFREFAFIFDGERFLRNQAFKDIDHMKNIIKKLRPTKIDIGAVYNISPLEKPNSSFNLDDTEDHCEFYPVQKEFVIDIDITDYDEVRSCCSDANLCNKCWKYMIIAVKILDEALREDFGFKNILWTFSGRRGIHCWICDKKARFLRKNARGAVVGYLQIINGGIYMKKKVHVGQKLHRCVKRALRVIEPLFLKICIEEQNILGTENQISTFLGIIENDEMRQEIQVLFAQHSTSFKRWEVFKNYFKKQISLENESWCKTPFLIEEIMIQYTYPRLDLNVSLGFNHLLKSPFSVHPKTGKIGVPLDPKFIDEFDPNKVPSIEELLDEIDEYDIKKQKEGISIQELKKIPDIEKTSLNKYHKIFKDFIDNLENISKQTSDSYCVNNDDDYRSDVSMEFD